ncbi:unnamed protein product [Oppiella nova]|uniref:BTB domain-containing protein n=1 Tax=Oppiella nova TaxID=334625 RepID=A0A7R9LH05_9ACAR|nr:unnamed protein product [Oppiella nova]CAG2163500.1 unnamed protein product [Oppiella nova]
MSANDRNVEDLLSLDTRLKRGSTDKWVVFSLMDEEFVANIHSFVIHGTDVIVVTKADEVFHGKGINVQKMTKMDILCQKGVKKISTGAGGHICALTYSGEVYVVDIVCGANHTLALTGGGHVYSWGYNESGEVGNGTVNNQSVPYRVSGVLANQHVTGIACGNNFSVAITETGQLFNWGNNSTGQLGLANLQANQPLPIQMSFFNDMTVSKVVCGFGHTLVLTDDGQLYTFGRNSNGELGTGNNTLQTIPYKLDAKLGRFIDIASIHSTYISTAVTFVTPYPIIMSEYPDSPVLQSTSKIFNHKLTSTFKFIVEGKPIHVHIDFLVMRCEHFRAMFDEKWDKGAKPEMELNQYSYVVYEAFLRYIYTGEVCVEPETGIELLDLAESYCETDLKIKCVRLIRKGITIENVSLIYAAAIRYKVPELEDLCFKFALAHITAVIQTPTFDSLEPRIYKNFIAKASVKGVFKR